MGSEVTDAWMIPPPVQLFLCIFVWDGRQKFLPFKFIRNVHMIPFHSMWHMWTVIVYTVKGQTLTWEGLKPSGPAAGSRKGDAWLFNPVRNQSFFDNRLQCRGCCSFFPLFRRFSDCNKERYCLVDISLGIFFHPSSYSEISVYCNYYFRWRY